MEKIKTSFSLYFPQNSNERNWKKLSKETSRSYFLHGETVDVLLVARFAGDVEDKDSLLDWRTTTPHLSASSCVTACSFNCRPKQGQSRGGGGQGGRQVASRELTCPPCSVTNHSLQEHQWWEVNAMTLVYPLKAAVQLPSGRHKCQTCRVWSLVYSPSWNSTPAANVKHLETFLRYTDEVNFQQEGKILWDIIQSEVPLLHPPDVNTSITAIAGQQHLFLQVSNRAYKKLTIHSVKVSTDNTKEPDENGNDDDTSLFEDDTDKPSELKVTSQRCPVPLTLAMLEMESLHFELGVGEPETLNNAAQEFEMCAIVTWSMWSGSPSQECHAVPLTTKFRLPSVCVRRPGFVITAHADLQPRCRQSFNMTYTVVNNIQNLLSLRLVWSPERALNDPKAAYNSEYRRAIQNVINSVICHQTSTQLGPCQQGSTVSVTIGFQILNPGLYELGQHMKLKLQTVNTSSSRPRSDSTCSTQSLPVDTPGSCRGTPLVARKSASMTPIGYLSNGSSSHSIHHVTNHPHSIDRLGAHTAAGGGGGGQHSNMSPRQSRRSAVRAAKADVRVAGRASSGARSLPASVQSSPTHPMHPEHPEVTAAAAAAGRGSQTSISSCQITAQDVLKRNCQVYVMD